MFPRPPVIADTPPEYPLPDVEGDHVSQYLLSGTALTAFHAGVVAPLAPCRVSVSLPPYVIGGLRSRTWTPG